MNPEGEAMVTAKKMPAFRRAKQESTDHVLLITRHSTMPTFNLASFHFIHNIVTYHIYEQNCNFIYRYK